MTFVKLGSFFLINEDVLTVPFEFSQQANTLNQFWHVRQVDHWNIVKLQNIMARIVFTIYFS